MKKREIVTEVLGDLGYVWYEDNDGDLILKYQMKNILILMGDEDENYVSMVLPRFVSMEDGDEILNLTVCNKITREIKLVKVFVDLDMENISASCEFYYTDTDSLRQNIENSLSVLGVVASIFRNTKLELSE